MSAKTLSLSEMPMIKAITPVSQDNISRYVTVSDITGKDFAKLIQLPRTFISHAVKMLRKGKQLTADERKVALKKAGQLFHSGTVYGFNPNDYVNQVVSATGLPEEVIKKALQKIGDSTSHAFRDSALGIAKGIPCAYSDQVKQNGCAQVVRKGDVLAVVAPGNGTGVHALWPQAIALGYRVVIRPSEREPWTAQRLVQALTESGLADYVVMLPTPHDGVEEIIEAADLSIVYGGEDTVMRYENRQDILVQGPGRSKMVIGNDYPQLDAFELVFESVLGLGGAACVCTSSVFIEGDATAFACAFMDYVHDRLQDPNERERYLPQLSSHRYDWWLQQVERYQRFILSKPEVFPLKSGTRQVMPLILLADLTDQPIVQLELPVASVTFVPFQHQTCLSSLAPALVVSVATKKADLIQSISEIPEIRNLYIGQVPTTWMKAHVPHDGYIAEFLTRSRGYRVDFG
ncbi:aldehyde dehydrogenase family protein [Vibrio crassostreae]|uniref:aldehyde dehydrogenase family protein n=1 Tax=Vibrio crassostreae TaxID=246167 RepID=UPI00104DB613|nr:aldehyde dehydrogenase family protein [Vibrio crassostreae]TCN75907.1 acyl-CoA reductase-like NAD-dependent aldehyde dehydrogenase [Vibrio crassostreae]